MSLKVLVLSHSVHVYSVIHLVLLHFLFPFFPRVYFCFIFPYFSLLYLFFLYLLHPLPFNITFFFFLLFFSLFLLFFLICILFFLSSLCFVIFIMSLFKFYLCCFIQRKLWNKGKRQGKSDQLYFLKKKEKMVNS